MCSTIRSVPSKWLTYGHCRELYIVSVRSRIRTTFLPCRASCRRPNGRPSTHMLVWTPMRMTLLMPRLSSRFQISTPESLMASSSWISMAAICDVAQGAALAWALRARRRSRRRTGRSGRRPSPRRESCRHQSAMSVGQVGGLGGRLGPLPGGMVLVGVHATARGVDDEHAPGPRRGDRLVHRRAPARRPGASPPGTSARPTCRR